MFGTIKAIAQTAKELVHFLRLRQEMKLRRQLLDELERVEDESIELEIQIVAARQRNEPELADRILQRQVRRNVFAAGIYSIGQRADIYGSSEDGAGDGGGGAKERSADS